MVTSKPKINLTSDENLFYAKLKVRETEHESYANFRFRFAFFLSVLNFKSSQRCLGNNIVGEETTNLKVTTFQFEHFEGNNVVSVGAYAATTDEKPFSLIGGVRHLSDDTLIISPNA